MSSVSPPPDPSIIHVATSDMTTEQTKQWAELLTSRDGRERVLGWLMTNDPAIRRLYNTLSMYLDIDEGDQHLAAVLVLTKGLYSGNVVPAASTPTTGATNAKP